MCPNFCKSYLDIDLKRNYNAIVGYKDIRTKCHCEVIKDDRGNLRYIILCASVTPLLLYSKNGGEVDNFIIFYIVRV